MEVSNDPRVLRLRRAAPGQERVLVRDGLGLFPDLQRGLGEVEQRAEPSRDQPSGAAARGNVRNERQTCLKGGKRCVTCTARNAS